MIVGGVVCGDTIELRGQAAVGEGLAEMRAQICSSMGPVDLLETQDDALWNIVFRDRMRSHP